MNREKIAVMVVDDSALVRKVLTEILDSDPEIEVIAQAADPLFAMRKMESVRPDVIVLDVEMPRMDGLTFLQKLMAESPLPVVICSSLTEGRTDTSIRALELGAVEVMTKPKLGVRQFLEESSIRLIDVVKAAAQARLRRTSSARPQVAIKQSPARVSTPARDMRIPNCADKIIAIGASTGGTEALRVVLDQMPANAPGILITQHMPEKFTGAFARRLNETSALNIKEAASGDPLTPGSVLIAPGNQHMLLKRRGNSYYVEIVEGPLVSRHRPSVDVMFRSVARSAGRNAVGCLLTGMGKDGAEGLLEMKNAGARTFAQDEATSVVFGMPQAAWKCGAAEELVALNEVSSSLLRSCM